MNKQLAIEEFKSALFDKNEGSVQLDFLENRPLSDETIKFWDIGYCPPHVIYKPFPFLRGRIIIPLHDIYGNIVSFFGRKLDANTEEISKNFDEDYGEHSLDMFYKWCDSKWINEVYSKEKHLFGLYKNFDIISKQNYAILVEGCYDAIALWNFGAKNVLAICGTAFSSNQMALIYRTGISKILIMMDNDDAGNKATERILTKIKSFGFDGKQVLLPTGKDPEDYVRSVQTDINLLIQPQLDQEVIELK